MKDPKKDFLDFLNPSDKTTKEMDNRIIEFVSSELNPTHKKVFLKLVLIQSFIGFLTLIFCPQFEFSLTNNYELFHFFHHNFGEKICMSICGSIFIGSGAIFASYILNSAEIRKIRQTNGLYYVFISILALFSFLMLGAKVYLTMSIYWLIGAIIGGHVIFEINHFIKQKVLFF